MPHTTGLAALGLKVVLCRPCRNAVERWCRVLTVREGDDRALWSELSWPLARRIVPRLLERYGYRELPPGTFVGELIHVPHRGAVAERRLTRYAAWARMLAGWTRVGA